MVDLRKLLVAPRRRKKPRADAPKTIVPPREQPPASAGPAARLDAARDRLRREIPPQDDDERE